MSQRPAPAPDPLAPLDRAVAAGALRPLDRHLARWLAETAGHPTPGRLLAAALASWRVGQGDVCLDLAELAGQAPFPGLPDLRAPKLKDWHAELRTWPAVGDPAAPGPLVLADPARLYLGRYWHYERQVAGAIAARAALWTGDLDRARLATGLERLFPGGSACATVEPGLDSPSRRKSNPQPDWQRVAAATALLKTFAVVSGGPGTGKTRTVTAILALAADQARRDGHGPGLRIGLAAPTGKAAARLAESIRKAKTDFLASGALDPDLAAAIPDESVTLHRLLGTRPGRVAPRHGPDNPLHLDLLVVDEASMLDLPLAARLLAALPAGCRLILLGDRDQLASVQAGAVLGDICGWGREPAPSPTLRDALHGVGALPAPAPAPGAEARVAAPPAPADASRPEAPTAPPLGDCIALLRKSWRFDPSSGIARVAAAVNRGDGAAALAALDAGLPDARRLDLDPARDREALARFVADFLLEPYRAVLAAGRTDPAAALAALGRRRILCALREGPFGAVGLNRLAERVLAAAGLIRPAGALWAGRPLLVTANDYELGLFNGDTGLILADPASGPATGPSPGGAPDGPPGGRLRAWFETADGVRAISPHRLPPVETLFAMTVHKSQGSELDRIALVLPEHDSPVVTRELIYTGITRAREQVTVVAAPARVREGIARRVSRASGLYDALWSGNPKDGATAGTDF